MSNGLSKKTNMTNDIAKKQAVKIGSAPFTKAIGSNHIAQGNHSASHQSPGGKISPKKLAGVGKGK